MSNVSLIQNPIRPESVIITAPKRRFNLILDIYNTASWTGRQFDATFTVDLKRIVPNPNDLAKPYKVTFGYFMQGGAFATSGLSQSALYSLHLDFRRNTYIQYLNRPQPYAGNLMFQTIINAATPTLGQLIAYPIDNSPIYLDNLLNLTEIQAATIVNSTPVVFNSSDNSGVNAITKYIIYIHFEEL